MPPSPSRAIFLSYAREDTDAARRIADALHAFGLEVWFDQNELRGGDAWDAKIKRQIRECALFLPIISAHTQERAEGYFRREWKLAVERTHDMAAGVAYLVPVVIDDTAENDATVPEEFLRVQWTRLPHGVPSPQFVDHVTRLLNAPRKPAGGERRAEGSEKKPAIENPLPEKKRPGARRGLQIAVGVVAVCATLAVLLLARKDRPPAVPAELAKSIAVLPFVNLSSEKDSEYFCDGVHEDLLTNLAHVRELRVVSRTSVAQYRTTTKPVPQIARELSVGYVLLGSVRRAANTVRVSVQLIRATTDEHVWAETMDRDLHDIFAIQSELAQEIAAALQAALSPQEKNLIERRPTENLAAYDLYLKAREERNRGGGFDTLETLLRAAVELDPRFADAWGELARVHAEWYFQKWDRNPERLAKATAEIERAVSLAPESPEVIRNRGNYFLYGHRDFARATEQLEKLRHLRPNDAEIWIALGEIQSRQGKWTDALASFRQATRFDPGNVDYARRLQRLLRAGRRWDDAIAEQRRIATMLPDRIEEAYGVAFLHFNARGSRREVDAFLAALPPAQADSPRGLALRMNWAIESGDYAEALRLDRLYPANEPRPTYDLGFGTAMILAAQGDLTGARERVKDRPAAERARLEREPNNIGAMWFLGLAEAMLGNKEEALQCARRTVEMMPESLDAIDGPQVGNKLAVIYMWAGEKDRALAEATRLLRTPNSEADVHMMRHDPWWFPLRGDPRFEALLDDPTNNAPLF